MSNERLYIKVILPKQGKEVKGGGGGAKVVPFKPVSDEFKNKLIAGVADAEKALAAAPISSKIIVAKAILEKKALAKSHLPDNLFDPTTCPIVGVGDPGELFVKVTPKGAHALKARIGSAGSKELVKSISAVTRIAPLSSQDRLAGHSPEQVFEESPKGKEDAAGKRRVKATLFAFSDARENESKRRAFVESLKSKNVQCVLRPEYTGQDVYEILCSSPKDVEIVAQSTMVRTVSKLPVLQTLFRMSLGDRKLPEKLPELVGNASEYPVVAVVDSGVDPGVADLERWIYQRVRTVADDEINTYHGTFVAGLVAWGHALNPGMAGIGEHPCRILDVHVLPNRDPAKGKVGFLTEPELLQDLEECVKKHANEVKVWNFSMGTNEVCKLKGFSDLAIALDNLQEKYDITFVLAAGNYKADPLLNYPRSKDERTLGRITSPADAVLGVTVGSIAHCDHPTTGVKKGEPSPFSRNGPGPNHIVKPDLVHFGGNIGKDQSHPLGVTSIISPTTIGEDLGTSMSTPLISRQLAYVHHRITPVPSATLARGVLFHNAVDSWTGSRVKDKDDHFLGHGIPLDVDKALECNPWTSTLVFEETLRPGFFLEWDDFPYPGSLRNGNRFQGEISMTLAYPPRRNAAFGTEYCETHVEASFGVYRKDKFGDTNFHGQVPTEHGNKGELYEDFKVQVLRKWAPVRTYHKLLKRGATGLRWKLRVSMLSRHDGGSVDPTPQKFVLLLTISDPLKKAPVYDEMAVLLRNKFQMQNLLVRPQLQARA